MIDGLLQSFPDAFRNARNEIQVPQEDVYDVRLEQLARQPLKHADDPRRDLIGVAKDLRRRMLVHEINETLVGLLGAGRWAQLVDCAQRRL